MQPVPTFQTVTVSALTSAARYAPSGDQVTPLTLAGSGHFGRPSSPESASQMRTVCTALPSTLSSLSMPATNLPSGDSAIQRNGDLVTGIGASGPLARLSGRSVGGCPAEAGSFS